MQTTKLNRSLQFAFLAFFMISLYVDVVLSQPLVDVVPNVKVIIDKKTKAEIDKIIGEIEIAQTEKKSIDTILFCIVQEFENIIISTNSFKTMTFSKSDPENIVAVTYQPISKGIIKERYNINSKYEQTRFYRESYSPGATQYIGIQNKNRVITYFGESKKGEFWIKLFTRNYKNGGSVQGFRISGFTNMLIGCNKNILRNPNAKK